MNIPVNLKYSKTHEWAEKRDEAVIIIGITDYAQKLLGDVVFVELPAEGIHLRAGESFGVVESVKAASDLYSPISGEVVAINQALSTNPELINHDPYQGGWIIKVKAHDLKEWENLLDAKAYVAVTGE